MIFVPHRGAPVQYETVSSFTVFGGRFLACQLR
jgi:hypothetical protein